MLGPIVYCLETHDLPADTRIEEVYLPRDFRPEIVNGTGALDGLPLLKTKAFRLPQATNGKQLYGILHPKEPKEIEVTLIPYYAWNNRGTKEMTIWLPVL